MPKHITTQDGELIKNLIEFNQFTSSAQQDSSSVSTRLSDIEDFSSSLDNIYISSSGQNADLGNLSVESLTANEFFINEVTRSVLYESGSSKFGDTSDDTHEFTGSILVSGSIQTVDLQAKKNLVIGTEGGDAYIFYNEEGQTDLESRAIRYNSTTQRWQISNKTDGLFSDVDIVGDAGVQEAPIITNNGDGTIDVSSASVILYSQDNWDGAIARYIVPAVSNLGPISQDVVSYLVASFNGGSPVYYLTNVESEISDSDKVLVATLYNHESSYLHYIQNSWGLSTSARINRRLVDESYFKRTSGLTLSESAGRVITIGAGTLWWGTQEFEEPVVDSSTNLCEFWYHSASVWEEVDVSTYNNTQYDDGTELQPLGINNYGVNWVYRFVNGLGELTPKVGYILGNGSYNNIAAAVAATFPSDTPDVFDSQGILVGRIIVQRNASTATQINSAFGKVFEGTVVSTHNDLSGIQGGQASQYYHLTQAQHNSLTVDETIATASYAERVRVNRQEVTSSIIIDVDNTEYVRVTNGPSTISLTNFDTGSRLTIKSRTPHPAPFNFTVDGDSSFSLLDGEVLSIDYNGIDWDRI